MHCLQALQRWPQQTLGQPDHTQSTEWRTPHKMPRGHALRFHRNRGGKDSLDSITPAQQRKGVGAVEEEHECGNLRASLNLHCEVIEWTLQFDLSWVLLERFGANDHRDGGTSLRQARTHQPADTTGAKNCVFHALALCTGACPRVACVAELY